MKRSNQFENVIMVMATSIAIALLASACGPGKMKTLTTGARSFVTAQESSLNSAIQEKRTADLNEGAKQTVDVNAVEDLANRLYFVSLRELSETTAKLTIQVKQKDGTPYFVTFTEPQVTEDRKTVTFTKNISREIENENKLSENAVVLPYTAEIKISDKGNIVSIFETSKDGKVTEVAAIVRMSKADVQLNSKDKSIEQLKDADFNVRMTQLYISDNNVFSGKVKYLNSNANRVIITGDSKSGEELFSLNSKIDLQNNSTELKISRVSDSLKNSFNSDAYKATLTTGDAVIKSDILAISLTKKKADSKDSSSITLRLVKKQTAKDATQSANADQNKDNSKVTAEDINTAESRQYDVSTSLTPPETSEKIEAPSIKIEAPQAKVTVQNTAPKTATATKSVEMINGIPVTNLPAVNVTATVPKQEKQSTSTFGLIMDSVTEGMQNISDYYKKAQEQQAAQNNAAAGSTAKAAADK